MRSIRSTLLVHLLGGTALVLAIAGAAVYHLLTRSMEAQFDANLSDRVHGLASLLFQVGDEVEFEFSGELMPEYEGGEEPSYFELRHEDGRLFEGSESLRGAELAPAFGLAGEALPAPTHWSAPLPDGRDGRWVAQQVEVHHVYPEEGPQRPHAALISIAVAQGREELVATERRLFLQCLAGGLVLTAAIGALGWLAAERGLEPARRLAERLDALRVDDLPAHLETGTLPPELAPIAAKADALIARVRTALERERRTTADIAHELRTPISELIALSEVALRHRAGAQGDGAAGDTNAARALVSVRDVSWRMARSVSTLLALARLDGDTEAFARVELDLGALLAEVLATLQGLADERGLCLKNRIERGERGLGDPDVLRIVLSNLSGNALQHAPPQSDVAWSLERTLERWRIVVENDAPRLEPADLQTLTQPFWRKDRARTDRDRAGLGLALSAALAERAGMELRFDLQDSRFRAVLAGPTGAHARRTT